MITGYNHNVAYKGHVFHIQTEDSGERHTQVITHLFSGGNIIHTMRNDYSAIAGSPDIDRQVRSIMENQHKDMARELLSGALDTKIEQSGHKLLKSDPHWKKPATASPSSRRTTRLVDVPAATTQPVEIATEKTFDQLVLEYLEKK